jgi:cytochrome c oxidase subunit 2
VLRGRRRPTWPRAALTACALTVLAGCGSNGQSTLNPHSRASRQIDHLWWGMLAAAVVVFAGTMALLALAWVRRRREGLPGITESESRETGLVVAFGIIIPVIALATLFYIADIGVVKATDSPGPGQTRRTIKVNARQFFWEARYPGTPAVTANEIHIPAGTPVKIVLTSSDVIHSFWVPELNKKIDAIPGHPNTLLLDAPRPGVYRGQCAEFCGMQHAKMAMRVYVDRPARFAAWLANMARALHVTSAGQRAGLQAFTANQCASCHTLRGTSAQGRIGPDLTHLMSRQTLAANTIPNTPAYLGAWIADPQHFKPGNKMPRLDIPKPQLRRLLGFLEGLK